MEKLSGLRRHLLFIFVLVLFLDFILTVGRQRPPPPPPPPPFAVGAGRRAWRAARGSSPVIVYGTSLWCPIPGVLTDWWLLPYLFSLAMGVPVLPFNHSGTSRVAACPAEGLMYAGVPCTWDEVDVFLLGNYADGWGSAVEAGQARNSSVRVFVASEAYDFSLSLVDYVDLSLGPRRDLQHLPQFTTFPLFMFTLVDPLRARGAPGSPCPLHTSLLRGGLMDAEAWRARSNFTLLLTTHMPHPRWLMYHILNSLAPVEHPGPLDEIRTFYWCAALNCSEIPNNRVGKVLLLQRFRYSMCPENKLFPGYVTEKIVEAHLAGAVPLYYGDVEAFPEVFNPKRVIVMHNKDVNASGVPFLEAVVQLETNATARREFFAQPVLAPTAQAWVNGQCQRIMGRFDAAMAALLERQLYLKALRGEEEGWTLAGRRHRAGSALRSRRVISEGLDCGTSGCTAPSLAECGDRDQEFCTLVRNVAPNSEYVLHEVGEEA